jgi:hypothetical protein
MLALCLDRRSAAEELQIGPSDQVVLEAVTESEGAVSTSVSSPVNLRINR